MVQSGRRLDFPQEAFPTAGPCQPLSQEKLQSGQAAHGAGADFEDLPHAALAQSLQEQIGSDPQAGSSAATHLVDLEGSQPVPLQQDPAEVGRSATTPRERLDFTELSEVEQAV